LTHINVTTHDNMGELSSYNYYSRCSEWWRWKNGECACTYHRGR